MAIILALRAELFSVIPVGIALLGKFLAVLKLMEKSQFKNNQNLVSGP